MSKGLLLLCEWWAGVTTCFCAQCVGTLGRLAAVLSPRQAEMRGCVHGGPDVL